MMRIEIVPALECHIQPIAGRARLADVEELWASGKSTPAEVMRHGLELSSEAWVGLADGEPICMAGIVPGSLLGGIGLPWLVGTDAIRRNARGFLPLCRPMVDRWLAIYPILLNLVDARNTVAIRWLKWLGFKFRPAVPFGPFQMPFHLFEMRGPHV